MNLRLGVDRLVAGEPVAVGVSIPVLVNLRLGEQPRQVEPVIGRGSQFLFW